MSERKFSFAYSADIAPGEAGVYLDDGETLLNLFHSYGGNTVEDFLSVGIIKFWLSQDAKVFLIVSEEDYHRGAYDHWDQKGNDGNGQIL